MLFLKISPFLLTALISMSAVSMVPTNHASVNVALNQAMVSMHKAMAQIRPTGNPDADFALMMIPHHEGAIEMAKAELEYGTDTRLRRLAQEIIITQQSEIVVMQLALKHSQAPATSVSQ